MKLVEEVARVLVSSKYKEASTTNVSVTDYIPADCGEIREEANVKMTAEQVAQLGKAVAAGDIGAAVVIAVEIAAGTTVRSIEDTGKVISGGKIQPPRFRQLIHGSP